MPRNLLICGILALSFAPPVLAGGACSISDWPLEMPHGIGDFLRVARAAQPHVVVTEVRTKAQTAGSASSQSAKAGAASAPPPNNWPPPTNWKARRSPSPSPWEQLAYAVMDDDARQVERLLDATPMDLNTSRASTIHTSLLNLAAASGEPEVARVLIAHGAHVRQQPGDTLELHPVANAMSGLEIELQGRDRPDPFYNRPPHSIEGYVTVIHVLLDAGADPDARLAPGYDLSPLATLMMMRRFSGDVNLADYLAEHGATVDGQPPLRSAIGIAMERGHADYVATLLSNHAISAATLNQGMVTAIARRDLGLGQNLLAAGANPNYKAGTVPILCRTLESAELRPLALTLLAKGADVSADCGDARSPGGTPLTVVDAADHELIDHLVARGGKLVVPGTDATLYREHGVDPSPINWALLHRRDHLASALLARDSTASNACGAVVYAARYGDAETLARLLALGGDPNSSSADGVSALMAAAFYGETRSMEVLLAQRRIELARTTHSHFNPGHFRIQLEGRSPPLFYGARTALMFAALGGSVEATSLLIAHGAPVHQRDAEGLEAVDYSQEAAVGHLFAGSPPTRH